jgi:hypothetical protein
VRLALVPSPLLGPATWTLAGDALRALGHDVTVVPRPAASPRRPADLLDHLRRHTSDADVLVVHSNAGLYAPHLPAGRIVFVDAALPPAAGSYAMAPAAMHGFLTDLADLDGLLPPWTGWWEEAQLAPLLPDAATRAAVEAEQHRLPLSYFAAQLEAPDGWTGRPAGYLAFGDSYEAERAQAQGWGWSVTTLAGVHLHQLVDPARVAVEVHALVLEESRS